MNLALSVASRMSGMTTAARLAKQTPGAKRRSFGQPQGEHRFIVATGTGSPGSCGRKSVGVLLGAA
jgi:hypothetical protein